MPDVELSLGVKELETKGIILPRTWAPQIVARVLKDLGRADPVQGEEVRPAVDCLLKVDPRRLERPFREALHPYLWALGKSLRPIVDNRIH